MEGKLIMAAKKKPKKRVSAAKALARKRSIAAKKGAATRKRNKARRARVANAGRRAEKAYARAVKAAETYTKAKAREEKHEARLRRHNSRARTDGLSDNRIHRSGGQDQSPSMRKMRRGSDGRYRWNNLWGNNVVYNFSGKLTDTVMIDKRARRPR